MLLLFCKRFILILGMLSILLLTGHAVSDELANVIDLVGIPPPYSFNRYCVLALGHMWVVGGRGQVTHNCADGTRIEQRLTGADLMGVHFVSSNVGWVVGAEGNIWHTADAGANWTKQRSGVRDTLEAVACSDERRCWVVGHGGVILRTSDGGERWETLKTGLSEDLYFVDFLNTQDGWAVGENGVVAHTANGGQTWEAQRIEMVLFPKGKFATSADLVAVKFTSEQFGCVAGTAGIACTTDGGKSWLSKLKNRVFIGIVSHGNQEAWAVGRDGPNYCTKDGGLNWSIWRR